MTAVWSVPAPVIADCATALMEPLPAGGTRRTVWYFGNSYTRYLRLREHVGDAADFAPAGDILNRIAEAIAPDIIDIDSQIRPAPDDAWRASDIGDRGPYASDLVVDICRCLAMMEALAEGGNPVFVVEDPDCGDALARVAQRSGHRIVRSGSHRSRVGRFTRLKRQFAAVRSRCRQIQLMTDLRRSRPVPVADLRAADVLIVIWTDSRTFDSETVLEAAPYVGRLPALLREQGYKVGYVGLPLDWIEYFGAIAANALAAKDPVLLLDDCLTPSSVAAYAWRASRLRFRGNLAVRGVDLGPLLHHEARREAMRVRPATSACFAGIASYLARHGIHPRAVVFPYENQPWEKAMRAAMRRHLPSSRIVGLQHCPFAEGYLSFYPSRHDIEDGTFPDALITMGSVYDARFTGRGTPRDRLVNGGAVRYEGVLDRAPLPAPQQTVLCCTGIEFEESLEIVHKSITAIAGLPDLRLVINFHPVTDRAFRERLKELSGYADDAAPGRVIFVEDGARTLLNDAAVVLYNSSSVAFDALAGGRPVIYVGRDLTLDQDKVPDGLSWRCRTPEALKAAIVSALADAGTQGRRDLRSMLETCLGRVRPAAIIAAVTGTGPTGEAGQPAAMNVAVPV